MKDRFENNSDSQFGPPWSDCEALEREWSRLEDVGDLHYHAAAYSSALDYYSQLLDEGILSRMPLSRTLRMLRKSIDSHILLGSFDNAEELLDRFERYTHTEAPSTDHEELAIARAVITGRRAIVLRERGELKQALDLAKRAFAVLALTDEHSEVARLQVSMGICHIRMGGTEKAEEFFLDGLSTFRRIGNDLGVANILNNLALLNKNRCNWGQAQSLISNALDLANKLGASNLLPVFLLTQGIILQKTNRLGESRTSLEKGLRLAISLGDRLYQTRLLLALGRLEILNGRLARAEELILEGKMIADRNRFRRESVLSDEFLGDVLLARGDLEKAGFNYQIGLEKCKAIVADSDMEGEILRRLAEVQLRSGLFNEAIGLAQASLAVCQRCGEIYEIGFCHVILGHAYAALDDRQLSDHHFREAIATFSEQGIAYQQFQAILEFTNSRLESADEAELLLLRRYLMEAQESRASEVNDENLCQILQALAHVQIKLEQLDDALLTVFELERYAAGVEDFELNNAVVQLRDRIESGLLSGVHGTEDHLQAISCIPELASGGFTLPRNLHTVLMTGLGKVQADFGFLAMTEGVAGARDLQLAAREGMTENLCQQLASWYGTEQPDDAAGGACFFSRLDDRGDLIQAVPALAKTADSCLFMPIAMHGRRFGLLFLGKKIGSSSSSGFDRTSLDFLATFAGFLALFLIEKGHGRDAAQDVVSKPTKTITRTSSIITHNDQMLEVIGLARKVASSDLTVLLNGETGTGKGLVAQTIHSLSRRAEQKMVSINCAAIPESLLESELFGHVKGSFTGADSNKKGLLEEAEGGTVFLDEIGKMPFSMQGKLLHFMDSRVVRPVGSNREFQVDVRVLCASKSDLHQAALRGEFLEDLYYRLLDFPLVIPPLRERPDDIELLARHFLQKYSREIGFDVPMLSQSSMDILVRHEWPGNVRELEKVLKRAIVLAQGEGVLRPEHLPIELTGVQHKMEMNAGITPLKETLSEIECREIARALNLARGNKSETARMLKISYPNLLKKIRHYGISIQ